MKSDCWASVHTGLKAAKHYAPSYQTIALLVFFATQCHLLMQLHLILYLYAFSAVALFILIKLAFPL